MRAKYINPFTDFGFKRLFGEEVNKDLLIDFLNQLLPSKHHIKDLSYKKTENLGLTEIDRRAIFDIYCESDSGDRFIVELQKAKQNFFKDRSVFYATFPIREQADKGDWNFKLSAVYCIGILDFIFDDTKQELTKYVHWVQLKDQDCAVFYDKLTFVYIEMPKFTKSESELGDHFDKWLYFIKNLEDFDSIPTRLRDRIFEKAFATAEIAQFNQSQLDAYEDSLKIFRDMNNVLNTAIAEATRTTTEAVSLQIAKNGIDAGLTNEIISQITGLSVNEVEQLRAGGNLN